MVVMTVVRKRVLITGVVQGVGFRPFCWRLAVRHGLCGWIENDRGGTTLELQGPAEAIATWLADVRHEAPPLAAIETIRVDHVGVDSSPSAGFAIRRSATANATPGMVATVSADIATCAACLAEICDPANRRHAYPFTTCTDCGPRYTIIAALPYDRARTTMAPFVMCDACRREYEDPSDRRFHAQPNACPACGPTVWLTTVDDPGGIACTRPAGSNTGAAAVAEARRRLRAGEILAVKGNGGFHLVCDASNPAAVQQLRLRKQRPSKPLAVMVADVDTATAIASVDEHERRLLTGRDRPIVLLRKRPAADGLAPFVAPDCDTIGIMLPDTPLQHLLCADLPPLVMTSGNRSEEPIAIDNQDAARRLAGLVDGFLMHDRDIVVPCDDSVVRRVGDATLPIRRSRGRAPLPIPLPAAGPTVLAVGAEQKVALCLVTGSRGIMSQHIGDQGSLESLTVLGRVAEHLTTLFAASPAAVACDLHPGFLSADWAARYATDRGIPLVRVQHHEAHVASLLTEHGVCGEPVLGVCFDGTGYGHDGTIWGGEMFVVEGDHFRRAAHLEPFLLPGGDAAIRHPRRTALALLHAAGLPWDASLPPVRATAPRERDILARQLVARLNVAVTTSAGRLFDGVAALVGARQSVTFEAEAAARLESLAAEAQECDGGYPLTLTGDTPIRIDWRPLVARVVADITTGVPPAVVASQFHHAVVAMIVEVCIRLRSDTGIGLVGLTGGVFQNALLVERAATSLEEAGFDVLLHRRVPPNDGGLALGQAMLARARLPAGSHT
jgi:hydrogenase maturation protein HypF